ncbi:hypothetical protein EJ04DRAFT_286026 [Polyplosphaeria fusca]|uniref:F-box domain-containing protein n=1 Tax=Polyplosphaeria fusca TaxID=682080 RepID=A0A9P4V4K2_9PLEO|nr:hypothetical protein EJ04DRAFT_286026 [Polyplosphaeria fusca]
MDSRRHILLGLPEELRHAVFYHCDSATILSLSCASKATYDVCIRHLWHTIDLSAHNDEHWAVHLDFINLDVPADHARRSLRARDGVTLRRQRRLTSHVAGHPELASQTRVLRWTTMDSDPRSTFRQSRDAFNYGTDLLWNTFQAFTNLTELDIAFMTCWRELDPVPDTLFNAVTSVSLAGVASHAVVASIFASIEPSRLRHLRLNNLQTFSERQSDLILLAEADINAHRKRCPGAVQGYLEPWTGRCAALRSFHIMTTAQFVDRSNDTSHGATQHWPIEWRSFAGSIGKRESFGRGR